MAFSGSLNTASFLVFVEQVLLPQLWVGAIVGLDNLPANSITDENALNWFHHCGLFSDLIR